MSRESTKTHAVRAHDFARKYLQGRVIDIGCGGDLVVPHAEPFDVEHGDAQRIGEFRDREAYDAVCSSHCLEHMRDVPSALNQWWSLVREGGYLVIVVPDEDLYEQGGWPSLFNSDHKATFRLCKQTSWSPVSFDIEALVAALPSAEIISCERQDQGYDHSLQKSKITRTERFLFRLAANWARLSRALNIAGGSMDRAVVAVFGSMGAPVDQTEGNALAQIQVIARKIPGG